MVSETRNEALGIDICAVLSKMTDSKWPPLFVYHMTFLDIIENKICRDKLLLSLSMFSGGEEHSGAHIQIKSLSDPEIKMDANKNHVFDN